MLQRNRVNDLRGIRANDRRHSLARKGEDGKWREVATDRECNCVLRLKLEIRSCAIRNARDSTFFVPKFSIVQHIDV